jgi:hypothetical protein
MRPLIFMKKIALICLIFNSCTCYYSEYPVFGTSNRPPDLFHGVDPLFVGPNTQISARAWAIRRAQQRSCERW